MLEPMTVPAWVAMAGAVLAALAVFDRCLRPAVRYLLARRRELRHERLNAKLSLPIRPFKLAGRRALVEQLMLDPDILAAIEEEVRRSGRPVRAVTADARRYAFEVVPAFSAATYFRFGTAAARGLSTWLYRVRLLGADDKALEQIDPQAAVVFILNHRSNMDYVLATYLAASRSALSYAVGEWARVPGLEQLIRAMGGYFVRRDSSNPLYRRVLSRYIRMATAAGVTQAVFPEGGLSRDGGLQPARLGIISYIIAGFDPAGGRDVVFVPVGINYDRVLEDRVLMAAASTPKGEKPRFAFNPWIFVQLLWRNLAGRLAGSWYRYGYAGVALGQPISLGVWLRDRGIDPRSATTDVRTAGIERFGRHLMHAVGEVVPALPVALAATAVLQARGQPVSMLELKADVLALMTALRRRGAVVHVPRADEDYAVTFGIRMLMLREVLEERDGLLRVTPRDDGLLAFYANSIAHLVGDAAEAGMAAPAPLT
ncbi:MAG: 1-acyl-sn-glycerol-3-phosphate acyltransferase [Hyphomicrobiaceae bacterium]